MGKYAPDCWIIVSLIDEDGERTDKVFGNWYGGFGGSDSWKLSSGITKVVELEDMYEVHNVSGSLYLCYKSCEGMSGYGSSVMNSFMKQAEESNGKFTITHIGINEVQTIV